MPKQVVSDWCCARPLVAPLDVNEAADLATAFAALADPVRIRLLSLVAEAGECCACDLIAPLGKSQPTVSHHGRGHSARREARAMGLVECRPLTPQVVARRVVDAMTARPG